MTKPTVAQESQPAIFTVFAWHKQEDDRWELKTHHVAAHSSEKAESFLRQHQSGLLEDAECYISTDFLLDHLESFGACHCYSNSYTKGDPLSEDAYQRWVRTRTMTHDEDGEVFEPTIRAIH